MISLDHAVRQTCIIPETPPVIPSHHAAAALHPHTGMNDKYMMYNLRTVLLQPMRVFRKSAYRYDQLALKVLHVICQQFWVVTYFVYPTVYSIL